jgi:hypothetical protein
MRVIGIIIFLLFFHYSSLSQNKCVEVISDDNKPVQYVSVIFKKDRSVFVSDDKGHLCDKFVSKIKASDTVLFTAIGFQNRELVYSGHDTVVLQRRFVVLPVVLVKGAGVEEVWGTKKNPAPIIGYPCKWGFREILNSQARIIYPEGEYKKAEIQSVSFYDETGKGINVPVRIRVFLIGKDSLPIADYLSDNLIVNTKGKGWLKIDMKSKGLIFPKEGLAFAIELFAIGSEYYYKEERKTKTGKKINEEVYAFSLGMDNDDRNLTLMKVPGWGNSWFVDHWLSDICGNLVCRVKVKVWR